MSGSCVAGMMVCTPEPEMLNTIRFDVPGGGGGLAFESRIAWRNEPGPVSSVFVTVKTKGILTLRTPFGSARVVSRARITQPDFCHLFGELNAELSAMNANGTDTAYAALRIT